MTACHLQKGEDGVWGIQVKMMQTVLLYLHLITQFNMEYDCVFVHWPILSLKDTCMQRKNIGKLHFHKMLLAYFKISMKNKWKNKNDAFKRGNTAKVKRSFLPFIFFIYLLLQRVWDSSFVNTVPWFACKKKYPFISNFLKKQTNQE